jgi:hypothetical protein
MGTQPFPNPERNHWHHLTDQTVVKRSWSWKKSPYSKAKLNSNRFWIFFFVEILGV